MSCPSKPHMMQNNFCLEVAGITIWPLVLVTSHAVDFETGDWHGNCAGDLSVGCTKESLSGLINEYQAYLGTQHWGSHQTDHLTRTSHAPQGTVIEELYIPKTIKLNLFNDHSLKQATQLYLWKGPLKKNDPRKRKLGKKEYSIVAYEVSDEEVAEIRSCVHKFLLALLCSHKHGIMFSDPTCGVKGRNNNQVITNVLKVVPVPYCDPLMTARKRSAIDSVYIPDDLSDSESDFSFDSDSDINFSECSSSSDESDHDSINLQSVRQ
ncbi:nucleolar pre-ribosomal-associated protein 1 [Trichonephila clavipes]|nr:nucleolar pre-ribosomal-associated protein 1 [Trichonephila clavipes]